MCDKPVRRAQLEKCTTMVPSYQSRPVVPVVPRHRVWLFPEHGCETTSVPSSPNCVSTQATDHAHGIAPYRFQKNLDAAKTMLKAIVAGLCSAPNSSRKRRFSLRYEFTSALLRFVDDVEFVFDEDHRTIHFRSASRTGYSDLGVNRRRMEDIRALSEGKL